jgi:hypothetical protein
MWFQRPLPLYAARGVDSAGGVLTSVLVGLALVGCLILLRDELRQPDQSPVRRHRRALGGQGRSDREAYEGMGLPTP